MNLGIVYSRAVLGIQAPLVSIEVHIVPGLPSFSIVGLPEAAVRESKDRVRSAILNSQFEFPNRKLIINLAPADLPKEGGRFDLPIALGILIASAQLPQQSVQHYEFAGELALTGELRSIQGILPLALGSRTVKRGLIVPKVNAKEASLPGDNIIYGAETLIQVCEHLTHKQPLAVEKLEDFYSSDGACDLDLAEVQGQVQAKRALEIAASGGHSVLMMGPPGTGKTMLAQRLASLMPSLTLEETLEVVALYSLSYEKNMNLEWGKRPFRAPHHSISSVALVGGGSRPKPGEISLAHNGILFLDELPEFNRRVLEVLREPLESGSILISRAATKSEFPAKFQLITAMNPCPCGYLGDQRFNCRCTQEQIKRYLGRLSGPLLDRIDMFIDVPVPNLAEVDHNASIESSASILSRVTLARQRQYARSKKLNAYLNNQELKNFCQLSRTTQTFFSKACENFGLSARSYHRILKVARSIADLNPEAELEVLEKEHIAEALTLRKLIKIFNGN